MNGRLEVLQEAFFAAYLSCRRIFQRQLFEDHPEDFSCEQISPANRIRHGAF